MRLLTHSFKDAAEGQWDFSSVNLKKLNLLVGATGSGKTKFLNSIFNVAQFVHGGTGFRTGSWEIGFAIDGITYRWKYEGSGKDESAAIVHESLVRIEAADVELPIFERNSSSFIFNGQSLPKLSRTSPAIFLLREEPQIAPIHREFGLILRRNFWGPDLLDASGVGTVPDGLMTELKNKAKSNDKHKTFLLNLPLGVRLYALQQYDREKYEAVIDQFRAVFPSIESISIKLGGVTDSASPGGGITPVLFIKERDVSNPVPLHQMSSGMQKVLLIIADVITIAKGSVYLIDEYENSLGINAVNFLPGFLSEYGDDTQFLITSHHPYLINSTPMSNWCVFKRKGSKVQIESGELLLQKYGSSKQEAFVKLMNDPDFSGGYA